MLVKKLKNCREIVARDDSMLREIFHSGRDGLKSHHSLAHAIVKPGKATRSHKLESSEVYYLLEGRGKMHVDSESELVKKDDAVYIPPGAIQYIENVGNTDLKFLCIVDPAWQAEDEEVLE